MASRAQNNRGRRRGASQRHGTPHGTPLGEGREVADDAPLGEVEPGPVAPGLDSLLNNIPAELARQEKKRLGGLAAKHTAACEALQSDALAPLSGDEYDAMTSLVVDTLWQVADDAALETNTRDLMLFFADNSNAKKRPPEFDQLWRIMPRIMRCVPLDIMDNRRLTYDAEMILIGGTQVRHPIWPPTFCKALRVLVTHPFFDRCHGLLVVAVQYAVKLRTNDRRKWTLENPINSPFLDDLARAFANPHPDRSAQEIHGEVNQTRRGNHTPLVSAVLQEIEKAVGESNAAFQGSTDPFDPYLVTVADLRNVGRALDNVKSCGVAIYLDSEHIFTAVKTAMHSHDLPSKTAGVTRAL
ncbi:hypothetical protein B0I37DRAFT_242701 [Chaetomium sp. MPI-CAGE-AT-0009]|nr:hypothetical protein B0I37DRAFT_242701 [Chaetomium sp. MPI-CAGE-AT-0009]